MAKKSKVLIIIAIVLAVIIGGGAALYAFVEPIHNAVQSVVLKPEKYYEKVESDYFSEGAKSFSNLFSKVNNVVEGDAEVGYSTSLKTTLGQSLISEMGISDLESIAINCDMSTKDEKAAQNISLDYDDQRIITINTSTDMDEKVAYIQIPELSDSFLSLSPEDLEPYLEEQGLDLDSIYGMYGVDSYSDLFTEDVLSEFSLTEEEIQDVIERYSDILINASSDVTRENNYEGDIDGVDFKYTKLTCEISYDEFYDVAKEILEELQDDEIIRDFVVNVTESSAEITPEDYDEAIEEALENLKDNKNDPEFFGFYGDEDDFDEDDTYITLTTYVNSDMDVVGREIEFVQFDYDNEFGYIKIDNSKNYAIECWVTAADEDFFEFEGSLEKDDNALTGSFECECSDEYGSEYSFTIEYDDFEVIDEEDNLYNGDIIITTEIDGIEYEFVGKFNVDNKKQNTSCIINVDGEMFLTLELSYEETQVADIQMPDSDETTFNALDEDDMYAYMLDADLDGFEENMSNALGEDLYDTIFGYDDYDYDYDDYDDDYDDYDYDDYDDCLYYDFSQLEYKLNGEVIEFPSEPSVFSDYIEINVTELESFDYYTYESEDEGYSIDVWNLDWDTKPIEECVVDGFTIYSEDSSLPISINGIVVGSTKAELANAFGITVDEMDDYSIEFENSGDAYASLTFYFDGDVVSEISKW